MARREHIARAVDAAHPIYVVRAAGGYLRDIEGKKFLDFVGGICVLNVGNNHPQVTSAVVARACRDAEAARSRG